MGIFLLQYLFLKMHCLNDYIWMIIINECLCGKRFGDSHVEFPILSWMWWCKIFVHGGNCLIIVHSNPRHLCRLNPKKMFTLTLGKYELSGESSISKCYEMSTPTYLLPTDYYCNYNNLVIGGYFFFFIRLKITFGNLLGILKKVSPSNIQNALLHYGGWETCERFT